MMSGANMSSRSYRYRVLLVDENPKPVETLRNLLSSRGYGCEVALTWRDALAQVKRQVFDLVVCGYRLKDKNGVMLIQEMQGIKPGLAGLVLSNFSDMKAVAHDTDQSDAIHFMTRPFQDDKLLKTADDVIRASRKQKTAKTERSASDYILDHKVYSHSAISDLERVYPGITQGVWDEAIDKVKWRRYRR
ncbi:hypothetical protein GCM10023116_44030 [Kistimonas scapharcae]|uniref:Response regulatory domain-containing protein n=2 Tax=Kistimonas scapharcae TaxID=1036133 RepID=A0ABP8V820_9GAMM